MIAAAITICGCRSTPGEVQSTHPFVAAFLEAVATFEHIQNIEEAIWIVEVGTEYEMGYGWAAEVRDGSLYATDLVVDFRTGAIKDSHHAMYNGLSPNRSAALHHAFSATALPEPLGPRDFSWSPNVTAYAGRGFRYVQTLYIGGHGDRQQLAEWLDEAPRESMCDRPPVPIELCLPWIISQYYRAKEPEHDDDLPD